MPKKSMLAPFARSTSVNTAPKPLTVAAVVGDPGTGLTPAKYRERFGGQNPALPRQGAVSAHENGESGRAAHANEDHAADKALSSTSTSNADMRTTTTQLLG
jgi:hypothetical protein